MSRPQEPTAPPASIRPSEETKQAGRAVATERQREKAEQERLCRSMDLHEYLTMKGEI